MIGNPSAATAVASSIRPASLNVPIAFA